jgi:hypothetical protein
MRFVQHLTEGRTEAIQIDDARDIVDKKCKKAVKQFKNGNTIYRGVYLDGANYAYINPKKGSPRESAYAGHNYYTLLIDNLKEWKKFPKRSRSIVCSTDRAKAEDYGGSRNTYIVLPYDGAKIGVCPSDDIFYSFRTWSKAGISDGRNFNWHMHNMFNKIYEFNGRADKDWRTLQDAIQFVQENMEDPSLDPLVQTFYKDMKWIARSWKGTVMKTLEYLMSPKENRFQLKTIGQTIPTGVEVWTDSEAILVRREFIEAFLGEEDMPAEFKNVSVMDLWVDDKAMTKAFKNLFSNPKRPLGTLQVWKKKSQRSSAKYFVTGNHEILIYNMLVDGFLSLDIEVVGSGVFPYNPDKEYFVTSNKETFFNLAPLVAPTPKVAELRDKLGGELGGVGKFSAHWWEKD